MRLFLAIVWLVLPCRADSPSEDAGVRDAAQEASVFDAANDANDAEVACGRPENRWYIDLATPSPDGLGWCCPRTEMPGCNCGRSGAYVTDPCQCAEHVECEYDANPSAFRGYTDEHGCMLWQVGWDPCGADDDAGTDAGRDSGIDSGADSDLDAGSDSDIDAGSDSEADADADAG